mmetsp:Transcript_7242/g.19413  ORF Transcript_7242/g.19413 Transcript_7242/m.19413 type:complete len:361 (-) Transcript_7242:274-1356(-)|eukprot:CAMPEP_0202342902 /NCGR_PEP_ID=MMETSP1126-20121109/3265_1 /ASSEMBLY_ACC=CAM_ASM_000457 /TAXON_ID=3047 /ORGANISM="Dunaliella tertiolecta, Strain CCMP1320" /LENGTH=360 /DNA_ID=CAMNT_0048933919 /DNA_START=3 /DNA_END=1085 /DNA_ORIENTATION=+
MKVVLSFTGGKDSVLALSLLQLLSQKRHDKVNLLPEAVKASLSQSGTNFEVVSLVTFAPAGSGVTSFKAHPFSIIQKQAQALGMPHSVVEIEGPDYHGAYVRAMRQLCVHEGEETWGLATGDILDVCSGFMEKAAAGAGVPLIRPLWGISGKDLLQSLWALDIVPMISCINKSKFAAPAAHALKGSSECEFQASSAADSKEDRRSSSPSSSSSATTTDVHAYGYKNSHASDLAGSSCQVATPGHCAPSAEQLASSQPSLGPHDQTPASSDGHVAEVLQDPVGALLMARLTREFHATHLEPANAALGVHPCGEWGEFHTMCLDGPTFVSRLELEASIQQDADFAWCVPTSIALVPKEVQQR